MNPIAASRSLTIALLLALLLSPLHAADRIRLGVLQFGTTNWELAAMQNLGIDRDNNIALDITPLASLTATQIALKSGAVDVIVSDWFWVNLQRSNGDALQMIPYSTSVGSLMVPADSKIASVGDLRGKRIGIAGSPLSKGWILLQAAAAKEGFNLEKESTQKFGAPPLMSESLKRGQLDAALTYWHFAARLQASGLKTTLPLKAIQTSLGLQSDIPMLGYVFREDWAKQSRDLVQRFARAANETKRRLAEDEAAWTAIRPLMKVDTEEEFRFLRQSFIDGIPSASLDPQQLQDAGRFYELMRKASREYQDSHFDANSFWRSDAP